MNVEPAPDPTAQRPGDQGIVQPNMTGAPAPQHFGTQFLAMIRQYLAANPQHVGVPLGALAAPRPADLLAAGGSTDAAAAAWEAHHPGVMSGRVGQGYVPDYAQQAVHSATQQRLAAQRALNQRPY